MPYSHIEDLLKQTMGLDAESIGSAAISSAVRARQSACELADVRAYRELVRTSARELQALIEAVVVAETWFFRDREAFAELTRVAIEEWLPANPVRTLRLLSLPCSSGEEPYTMAMALLDAGLPANRFRIDAVDISARALAKAQRAVYGKNSFRGVDLSFRNRHFELTTQGHHPSDAIRQQVHFRQGNLLAVDFMRDGETYDCIFCRNLLIYFDRKTQDRAVALLRRILKPGGVLFVGASESSLLLAHDFFSIKAPLTFAFRCDRSALGAGVADPARVRFVSRNAPVSSSPASSAIFANPIVAKAPEISARPPAANQVTQDEALRLADQGRLTEATQACEEDLRRHGPSARTFFLMGLIHAAAGDLAAAGQSFRKTLYLDQNHQDALVHLGLLLEKQGGAGGAQVLRDRLQRLRPKKKA